MMPYVDLNAAWMGGAQAVDWENLSYREHTLMRGCWRITDKGKACRNKVSPYGAGLCGAHLKQMRLW